VLLETKRDTDGIMQRLCDEEARKLSIVHVELANLRRDLQHEEITRNSLQKLEDAQTAPMVRVVQDSLCQ